MIEKFTPEELRQIKKELRERECADVQKRTIFFELLTEKGIEDFREFYRIERSHDFEKAAYIFADVMTNNFITYERNYRGNVGEITKANSIVPFQIADDWEKIVSEMMDMYFKKYKE